MVNKPQSNRCSVGIFDKCGYCHNDRIKCQQHHHRNIRREYSYKHKIIPIVHLELKQRKTVRKFTGANLKVRRSQNRRSQNQFCTTY